MDELKALQSLARAMGIHTRYTDGLGKRVTVAPETLVRVCAALGAAIHRPSDAVAALKAHRAAIKARPDPLVVVDWNRPPYGYRRNGATTVISAPVEAWRRQGQRRGWGVATQVAALRSARSRSVGDLNDLESMCRWIGRQGGDLVTVLPLAPTFNTPPVEPSPYAPVSRLFWSELLIDLESRHRPADTAPTTLDVTQADAEVRQALEGQGPPTGHPPDGELLRYARFRGAQARLGRNWRAWPAPARYGLLDDDQVDPKEERFHRVAQPVVRAQLSALRTRLDQTGVGLGLDLAVGVHPDGYDPWSRPGLFAEGMSVGAPPDPGFPSGQDWGFSPVHPVASRVEGHQYLAASIAHQASLARVLRIDHIMAWTRLYWIPHGMELNQGTYVSYPADELFAVLTLESHRHQCEVVGENLGTVPRGVHQALPRHRIWGMYVAQFQAAGDPQVRPPHQTQVALTGTHDTPTFAGWLAGTDIEERVKYGLLDAASVPAVRRDRLRAIRRLARRLGGNPRDVPGLLGDLLEWLGSSESPLVVTWLEDLWLEERGVNLPGTRSSERPNWQRPMGRLLDEVVTDPAVGALLRRLNRGRGR